MIKIDIFLSKLRSALSRKNVETSFDLMKELTIISNDFDGYNKIKTITKLPNLNVWGAFNYDLVKDIMLDNDFGISPMHIDLNHIYFQENESFHQQNKKTAIRELSFLSKDLQYKESEYTSYLFSTFCNNISSKSSFNLVEQIINPIIFISALKDLDLLEMFDAFNPENPNFEINSTVEEIALIFEQRDYLQKLFYDKLQNGIGIPDKMKLILDNAQVEEPYLLEDLPKFFTSMVFANAETVASYVTSFIYFMFTDFHYLFKANDWEKIEDVANEVLRIYIPTPMAFRTVKRDKIYNGKELKTGDLVVLFLRHANLDSSIFPNPMRIEFGRKAKHLSFGRGKLACIGQFASFRISMNIIKEFKARGVKLTILDSYPNFDYSGMIKIKVLNASIDD